MLAFSEIPHFILYSLTVLTIHSFRYTHCPNQTNTKLFYRLSVIIILTMSRMYRAVTSVLFARFCSTETLGSAGVKTEVSFTVPQEKKRGL